MENKHNHIVLRDAGIEDLDLLKYWDEQPHVVESDPNDDRLWESELRVKPPWREMLIAELNKRPIGFIQIIDPAKEITHYWGNVPADLRAIDIWIGEKEDIGKGYGTTMMHLALERCFVDPQVKAILIDPLESNHRARKFYESLGFQFMENRIFGEDFCAVYQLQRKVWEDRIRHLHESKDMA